MYAVIALLKIKFLRRVRRSVLLKAFRKKEIGLRKSILLYGMSIFIVFLAFLIAMFLWPGIYSSSMFKSMLTVIIDGKTILISGLWIIFFYYGSFYGSVLVYELTISSNLSYLSLPLLYSDLALLRMTEAIISAVKPFILFLVPTLIMLYLHLGLSIWFFPVSVALLQLLCLSSFVAGVILLLALKSVLKKIGSDRIFVTFFIISVWIFVLAIRLHKSYPESAILGKVLRILDSTLGTISFRTVLERTLFPSTITILTGFIAILVIGTLVFSQGILFYQLLLHNYKKIHYISEEGKVIRKRRANIRMDRLYVILKKIPADLRIILARDIILFIRRPNYLLKAIVFILLMGVFFYNIKSGAFIIPKTIYLYLLPSFVLLRFYIHSIGLERNNIFLIKQLTPSMSVYFMNRAKVNALVSFLIVLPIWTICILFAPINNFILIVVRFMLLSLSLVASVFLLTGVSATFAIFNEDRVEHNSFGVSSGAVALFCIVGFSIPLFFYLIDILISIPVALAGVPEVFLIITGLISILSIITFVILGIRKLSIQI